MFSEKSGVFAGVNLTIDSNLPGAAVSISDQAVTIVDSNFLDLTPSAEASLIFSASNVTIQTANFTGNVQATAGKHSIPSTGHPARERERGSL